MLPGLAVSLLLLCLLASTAASAQGAAIDGAGSTFLAPLYQRWIETFLANRPQDHVQYEAAGSGEGLRRLAQGKVDFAGSDVCEAPGASAAEMVCLPVVAGAVVPIFNVPGVARDLHMTPQALAGIFLGAVKRWNDPLIREPNRGVHLPDLEILVVHRADASGTTYAFSDYLSKVDSKWRASAGAAITIQWPTGRAETGNEGVAQLVEHTPGSIGYVEFLYALRHRLGMIALRNTAGRYTRADLETVTAAAESAEPGFNADSPPPTISNAPAEKAYPIATFSWLILPVKANDPEKSRLLLEFVDWILDAGQHQAAGLGYVAIPDKVLRAERVTLARLRGSAVGR
jgi:phosphate transport system substrate-binding protein